MHKISIIIPVYNVEQYLAQCLDSVVNQSYRNLEIILVNDGSTDLSPRICDDYAAKDKRIIVIHKKNGGSAEARNIGMQTGSGDLVGFVDSDDLVALDFYEKLVSMLIQYDADIAECSFTTFEEDADLGGIIISNSQQPKIFETETALKLIMEGPLSVVVWNKIYKKELITSIIFPVGKHIDDEYWTYRVIANAKKIVKIPDCLYYYRQQPASIMGKQYSLKRLDALYAHEERILYMEEHFPNLRNLAIKVFCFLAMSHYHQLYIHNKIDPQKQNRKNIFRKVKGYNKVDILRNWNWKDIVWYQLFIWSPNTYMKLRNYMEMKVQHRLYNK